MEFYLLTDESEIRALISHHNENSEYVVLDFETTSKYPREAKLLDIQMSGYTPDEVVMFDGEYLPLLKDLTCRQVFWNFKYDWKVAALHGVDLRGKPMHDAMLLDHLADENRDHDLDSRVQELYQDDYKAKFWEKYENYSDASSDDKLDYGCRDIFYTARIYEQLRADLRADSIPDTLIDHIHRLALALFDTELEGVGFDMPYCIQMGTELKADIIRTETELRAFGGFHCEAIELEAWVKEIDKYKTEKRRATVEKPQFNFGSSDHIKKLLYGELKLPVQLHHKTKNPTVDDGALEALEDKHPLIPELRKLRKFQKMYSAFIEGILDKADHGRIYPSFNVNGTVTGRISHSEPNLGQMPSKGEWSKIRGIFIPSEGHKLITCDYSQLEVCIAAHFSMDKNLLKIIHEGASKHDITAESLGIERGLAKTLNFAMQYQCSPRKVAQILGCSQSDAEYAWNKYWETYAGEKQVIDSCKASVDAGKPIVNPFGRNRRFPTNFENQWKKEAAYRQAYSSLIQGTGSDITSRAFYWVSEELKAQGWGRALLTVHDEIIVESKTEKTATVRVLLADEMADVGEESAWLRVPLSVSCSDPLDRWTK